MELNLGGIDTLGLTTLCTVANRERLLSDEVCQCHVTELNLTVTETNS